MSEDLAWIATAINVAIIFAMLAWPRPNHLEDLREMFGISATPIAQVKHRWRRFRRGLPPAARVTTLAIQRAFGPVVFATLLSALALIIAAYAYPDDATLMQRAVAIVSNTLDGLSQGALTIPGSIQVTSSEWSARALLASFTFVTSAGLLRISQQWLLSIWRTLVCLVFRNGSYEVLSGGLRDRPKLAAALGVQS